MSNINMGGQSVRTTTLGIDFADGTVQNTAAPNPATSIGFSETPPGGYIDRVHFGSIDILAGSNFPDGSIYGGPGFAAPVGSLYIMYNGGEPKYAIYQKTGSGDKDWSILCDSGI